MFLASDKTQQPRFYIPLNNFTSCGLHRARSAQQQLKGDSSVRNSSEGTGLVPPLPCASSMSAIPVPSPSAALNSSRSRSSLLSQSSSGPLEVFITAGKDTVRGIDAFLSDKPLSTNPCSSILREAMIETAVHGARPLGLFVEFMVDGTSYQRRT